MNKRLIDPRKVCTVLVDRANYGRLKPVMRAIQEHPELTLQLVVAGTMVLERFSQPTSVVRNDGFSIDGEIYIEVEGSLPVTMAKSIGLGIAEFASEFRRLQPDIVLIIGDRYEALAATIAAAYMNICIVHIQGGEVSGSIDESARHAITKFAHFHYPSTHRAADYLIKMGERPDTILGVGCPSSDIALRLDRTIRSDLLNDQGSGARIDLRKPFLLVMFHPNTTEFGRERQEIELLLSALKELQTPTVIMWPNIDAGSDHVSKAIRRFRDLEKPNWLRLITNLSPENFHKLLANASCAIGNSSSFVRDAGFFGTPVVLLGDRQAGRETAEHVYPAELDHDQIVAAVRQQLACGRYTRSDLYGDGQVSPRIAESIARLTPYVQKRLDYVRREAAAQEVHRCDELESLSAVELASTGDDGEPALFENAAGTECHVRS